MLVPRLGECERTCNLCGNVCPTQAIRSLSLKVKSYAQRGTATIHRERCIVWEHYRLCLVCDEACPYGAIEFYEVEKEAKATRVPFVDVEV